MWILKHREPAEEGQNGDDWISFCMLAFGREGLGDACSIEDIAAIEASRNKSMYHPFKVTKKTRRDTSILHILCMFISVLPWVNQWN